MAMSLDQGGVAFTPAVPKDESQASALASIKPLSFHPTASPIQFQPLAGWATPSTHPELLFQGITGGISAIGQGITAAYKSKSDQAREDQLLADKYAHDLEVAKIRKGSGNGGGTTYLDEQGNQQTTPDGGETTPIPAGAISQNENGEYVDAEGNVISSDPNGFVSGQMSEVHDRMKATLPDSQWQQVKNKMQPRELQDETFKYKPEFGDKKNNLQVTPKALGSTAPIQEDNYVSSIRNPIPDIKAGLGYVADKAMRFGNLEDASRRQYVADTQAGRTPQNSGVFKH